MHAPALRCRPGVCRILDAGRGGFWSIRPLGGRAADEVEAERLYREMAPLIIFLMQSVDQFLCYGKRLTARRIGLAEVHDRAPAQAPTPFGLECLTRHAAVLERLR